MGILAQPRDTRRVAVTLRPLQGDLAICRLDAADAVPAWALAGNGLASVTRLEDELSVVCPVDQVPAGVTADRGWRGLVVAGPLDLELTGILSSLARPLAEAGVPIFAVATHDTDVILVRGAHVERAVAALSAAGHRVVT